jgi:hypothetical protein
MGRIVVSLFGLCRLAFSEANTEESCYCRYKVHSSFGDDVELMIRNCMKYEYMKNKELMFNVDGGWIRKGFQQ